ncbi:MAG: hypothetical protein ACJARR_002758 [Pseudophaeobacter arcticus]|jgi:hypothetical protein
MTVSTQTSTPMGHSAHKTGTLSPREQSVLWDMEEHFWTSGADHARATTADNAVMIFPYPPGILQGDQIWTHLKQSTGWRSVVTSASRRPIPTRCSTIIASSLDAAQSMAVAKRGLEPVKSGFDDLREDLWISVDWKPEDIL